MTATQRNLLNSIKTAQARAGRPVPWNVAARNGRLNRYVWSRRATLGALIDAGLVQATMAPADVDVHGRPDRAAARLHESALVSLTTAGITVAGS